MVLHIEISNVLYISQENVNIKRATRLQGLRYYEGDHQLRNESRQQHERRGTRDEQGSQNTGRQQHLCRSRVGREGGLKVYHTNCRSLRNKIDLLRGKECVANFDIIAVTETWIDINSKNFLSELKIEGY